MNADRKIPFLIGCALLCASVASAQAVPLDVVLQVTDLDYKPLPAIAGRLVFGSDPDWQGSNAGVRFLTGTDGVAHVRASVVLEKRWRKYPTNFIGSLLSTRQQTEYLRVAAELRYLDKPWLYALDLFRFPNDDTLLDDFFVYTTDERGRFTRKAERSGPDWKMADLDGLILTTPGFEPWDHFLAPDSSDPTGRRWTLRLGFKRSPPPVRR